MTYLCSSSQIHVPQHSVFVRFVVLPHSPQRGRFDFFSVFGFADFAFFADFLAAIDCPFLVARILWRRNGFRNLFFPTKTEIAGGSEGVGVNPCEKGGKRKTPSCRRLGTGRNVTCRPNSLFYPKLPGSTLAQNLRLSKKVPFGSAGYVKAAR